MASAADGILREIDKEWEDFRDVLTQVPEERMDEPGVVDGWSMKDVIGHVTTWENEMVWRVRLYLQRNDPDSLQYRGVDAFNESTVARKRAIPLDVVLDELHATHREMVQFIRDVPDTALHVSDVQRRIRVDTFEHYREHAYSIHEWLHPDVTA